MKNITKIVLIFLSLLIATNQSSLATNQALVRIKRSQISCEPIGRIIEKGNNQFKTKNLMCETDKLELVKNVRVRFLCFSTGDIIWLSNGIVPSSKCAKANTSAISCNPNNVKVCLLRKGRTGGDVEPTIIYPYTSSLMKTRPEIAWRPVPGATAYKVKVSGDNLSWERVVNQTHLTYPANQEELPFGQAFQITVIAYRKDAPSTADTFVVNLFSQSEIQQVLDTIEQINLLGLPEDEAALDIDAVYMSRGFLDESIKL